MYWRSSHAGCFMINYRAANLMDISKIKPKKIYLDNMQLFPQLVEAVKRDPAITVLDTEGTILAIFGFQAIYPGVGELWAVTTPQSNYYPIAFCKLTNQLLEKHAQDNSLRRVQMAVRADYTQGKKFATFLNFDAEGIMRRYGPEGADYVMFGRVF